jgi:nucleotide-binding universal stress UspA family protein
MRGMATLPLITDPPVPARLRLLSVLAVVEFDPEHKRSLSAASRSALRHAAAIAGDNPCAVTVLHVLPPQPRTVVFTAGGASEASSGDAEAAHRLRDAVEAERAGVDAVTRIARGDLIDEIVREADRIDADLVVAGYQDRREAYAEGFSTRALIHRIERPVLLTRATDGLRDGWEP